MLTLVPVCYTGVLRSSNMPPSSFLFSAAPRHLPRVHPVPLVPQLARQKLVPQAASEKLGHCIHTPFFFFLDQLLSAAPKALWTSSMPPNSCLVLSGPQASRIYGSCLRFKMSKKQVPQALSPLKAAAVDTCSTLLSP